MKPEVYDQLRKLAQHLKESYQAQQVILFGSYAREEAAEDSDVDILVIAPTRERFFERMATVKRLVRNLRDGLVIAPIVLTPEELGRRKQTGDQFIAEILEKGLAL